MITNGHQFRVLNYQSIELLEEHIPFATLLTFLHKEDVLWWCETESGETIAINPLNYIIIQE